MKIEDNVAQGDKIRSGVTAVLKPADDMSLLTDVITAEQLREDQDSVFEDVLTTMHPKIIIFDGKPSLILVSASEYQAQMDRLAIVEKIITGRAEIVAGRIVSNDQVIAELQHKIIATQKAIGDVKS